MRDRGSDSTLGKVSTPQLSSGPLGGTGHVSVKTLMLLSLLFSPAILLGQYLGGLSLTAGVAESAPMTYSISYLQPVLMKQLYVQLGYRYFDQNDSRILDFYSFPFSSIHQAQLGILLGDHLFASPKMTYNWSGRFKSIGWDITGGILVHPFNNFRVGISVGYDQFYGDFPLSPTGSTSKVSLSLVANVHPFE